MTHKQKGMEHKKKSSYAKGGAVKEAKQAAKMSKVAKGKENPKKKAKKTLKKNY